MNRNIFSVLLLLVLGISAYAAPPSEEEGKLIFKNRCAGCHNVNKKVLGPALSKVYDRHSMEWITNFIQSSQTVIKSGDKEAVALFEEYNNTPMPDHKDITAEQVESIVSYIKSQETPTAAVDEKPKSTGARGPLYRPLQLTDYGYITGFISVVLLLVLVLLLAVSVKGVERGLKDK
jgi:mono/diheme cytochrome c family protein